MSPNEKVSVQEILEFAHGFETDVDEAWKKLTRAQFPGNPARGFAELIQNSVDAYPSGTPWEDRWIKIETGPYTVAITDFGEGMGSERLRLLVTLGGTDKTGDTGKLGKFGIGFVAIFNPLLGTKMVRVITRCEGTYVELVFDVKVPDRRPELSVRVIDDPSLRFSTRVEVTFDKVSSPEECLEYARRCLTYSPCPATINGREYQSIWERARHSENVHFFHDGPCEGFIQESYRSEVVVLCKFEHIGTWSLANLLAGSVVYAEALQAFYSKDVPYVDGVRITINCNNLTVTISRDGFMLDCACSEMMKVIGDALADYLHQRLLANPVADTIRANQYVLRELLSRHMHGESEPAGSGRPAMNDLVRLLSEAKIYRLSGRSENVSLRDIQSLRSEGLPVFFSPRQTNLRWLGGKFKRDFVVLPTPCKIGDVRDFYDTLFARIFEDVVNLDDIENDSSKIGDLAARGIIAKDALRPRCKFKGWRKLTDEEREFLNEIDEVLAHRGVRQAIARHLHMAVSAITTGFIEVDEEEVTIATGLFDRHGSALDDDEEAPADSARFSNLPDDPKDTGLPMPGAPIRLGLRRDHPFIESLIGSGNPHRAYYALAFLAHELTLCQKRLVPYSRFYHWVKERMAADMRRALLVQLTGEEEKVPS